LSDSDKANEPLTNAREKIGEVFLNGNHTMAGPITNAKSTQEKAALADSLQAARLAVLNHGSGHDTTGGATHYNQRPTDSRTPMRPKDWTSGAPLHTQSGPYNNSLNRLRFINTYE